jgi:VanZ family protein
MNEVAIRKFPAWFGLIPIAVFVTLAHLVPGLDRTELDAEFRNSIHIVGFAAVAAVLYRAIRGTRLKRIALTMMSIILLGVVSEFAQYISGKTFGIGDLFKDVTGAAVYIAAHELWYFRQHESGSRARVVASRAVAAALAVAIFLPLIYWSFVQISSRSQFPAIASFEHRWEERLIKPKNSVVTIRHNSEIEGMPEENNQAVLIELSRRGRSGLIVKVIESDWSEFTTLEFDAATFSEASVWISGYVNDGGHAGMFGGKPPALFELTRNVTRIGIPLASMVENPDGTLDDLSDIREMAVLAHGEHENSKIMLDNFALR